MAKILLIEDDALLAKMYKTIISSVGHELVIAPDGEDGLEKARSIVPAMILLDIMMPKMNGLQVLTELKKDAKTKDIPVVVLTALTQVNNAEDVLAKGAVKFIDKGQFEPPQIKALIDEVLTQSINATAQKAGAQSIAAGQAAPVVSEKAS